MKMMTTVFFLLIVLTTVSACKKQIDLVPVAVQNSYLVVDGNISPGYQLTVDFAGGGYTASTPVCVDCTLRGTNIKPSFWR